MAMQEFLSRQGTLCKKEILFIDGMGSVQSVIEDHYARNGFSIEQSGRIPRNVQDLPQEVPIIPSKLKNLLREVPEKMRKVLADIFKIPIQEASYLTLDLRNNALTIAPNNEQGIERTVDQDGNAQQVHFQKLRGVFYFYDQAYSYYRFVYPDGETVTWGPKFTTHDLEYYPFPFEDQEGKYPIKVQKDTPVDLGQIGGTDALKIDNAYLQENF